MPPKQPVADGTRIQREQQWHDRRFSAAPSRNSTLRRLTGVATGDALRLVFDVAKARCVGASVLDYGCAEGQASVLLRRAGASAVHGIDISPVAVEHAAARARAAGLSDVTFEVMNAEQLALADKRFDLIFGIAILHHLDLARALREIARVLKPTGSAVFLEPLAHNPLINAVRRLTPGARTADEHPLTMADIELTRASFGSVETQFVNLTTLMAAPAAGLPGAAALHRVCAAVDRGLLRLPWISRFAWNVVLTLEQPRASTRS